MPIRSFWLIFLKVIGIFLLYSSLTIIPALISVPLMLGMNLIDESVLVSGVALLVGLVVYGVVVYLFIFRTAYVLELLRLEDGFEEDELGVEVQVVSVLTIAVIVTGGVMIVDGLPAFIKAIIDFLGKSQFVGAGTNLGWPLYYLAQLVLGYLLITKSKWVVEFIEQRANDNASIDEDDEVLDSGEMKE